MLATAGWEKVMEKLEGQEHEVEGTVQSIHQSDSENPLDAINRLVEAF